MSEGVNLGGDLTVVIIWEEGPQNFGSSEITM